MEGGIWQNSSRIGAERVELDSENYLLSSVFLGRAYEVSGKFEMNPPKGEDSKNKYSSST